MNSGSWSAVMPWPLIGLHAALLPDGRVLTFGTDENGEQGGQKIYDIWDPKTGLHLTSTKATLTDEFCSAEILDPITGNMIIIGGDARPQGHINAGVADVNTFDYHTGSLTTSTTGYLNFPRWYPSLISLSGGQFLAIGGEGAVPGGGGSGTPELYTPASVGRRCRGLLAPILPQLVLSARLGVEQRHDCRLLRHGEGDNAGTLFKMTTGGVGSVTNLGHTPFESENYDPAAMFAQDKILTIDKNGNGLDYGYQRGDADLYADGRRRLKSRLVEPHRSRRWHGPVNRRQQCSAHNRSCNRDQQRRDLEPRHRPMDQRRQCCHRPVLSLDNNAFARRHGSLGRRRRSRPAHQPQRRRSIRLATCSTPMAVCAPIVR